MTIYCYRDGILASDSGVFANGVCHGHRQKVHKSANGLLYACTARSSNAQAFHDWMNGADDPAWTGVKPKLDEDFSAHYFAPDGRIFYVDYLLVPAQIEAPFIANGYATDLAIGAMAQGATAIEAVEIALRYSDCVRGPVQSVAL